MREEKLKKVKAIEKDEVDLISDLPDVLVACIISLLPGMEIVRTSVLSHRWKTMWKYSSHLSFDQKQMLKSWIEFYIQNSNSSSRIAMAMRRKIDPKAEELMDTISEAAILIKSIMENHIGPLKSCSIQHLPESCASGDAVEWMKKLLNLGVIKVSMELELRYYLHEITDSDLRKAGRTLDLPFEIFSNFEIIELKNYHFTTIPFPNPSQVLKTLILNNVRIISNNFQGILSHCSSLEDLILDQCKFFEDELKIDSPSLKYVKMYNLNIRKILVFAANVEVIEIDSVICNHKDLVLQPPKLYYYYYYYYYYLYIIFNGQSCIKL
ncbi:F-box protein At1g80960-like [Cicer arietinum]|uniref:F-box protein At1g80960-like n=1 Tax=Cicer arietinum TaxID=3827 RepID=UPI003CC5B29C